MVMQRVNQQKPTEPPDIGYRNDPPGSPIGPYGHGDSGLFYNPGASNQVFSAMSLPSGGMLDAIPVLTRDPANDGGSNQFSGEMAALDTLLTGVTEGAADEFSNQPTTDCADGPVGGLTKLCTMLNTFGRFRVGVREVSMYRAGQRQDLCDPATIRLMNSPVIQEFMGLPSNIPNAQNAMANELARRMWESAVSFRRMFAPRVWIGSPANNSGERRDVTGLDIHINSGNKIDHRSSAVCTAANSTILDFGYDLVNGTGRDIVEYLEYAEYLAIEWIGGQQGLGPIDGWIAMRPEVWRTVSSVWPVRQFNEALNVMGNVFANGGQVVVSAESARADRERFRRERILPINGRNYAVVVDDTMPVEGNLDNAGIQIGQYASDIVFIPRSVMGGIPVTFFEMMDHANAQEDAIQAMVGGNLTFTTDGGRFRWYVNFKNGCMNLTWEFSPRLKVKTPQVGFRINNVKVEPLAMPRSWDPDSSYFANGGVTNTPQQKYYTTWSPTTPVTP